ncbi:hypothetical protein H2200_005943 [Cladophialophora chaetospira]|uniref:Uncharacterized protein n=1 Tax=Cladophialophora chaetospira TaxID=386627 RepID=A0AA39CIT0_9EURO|nr:hypothetical protein H2200_005943 [Cladophialophora chaetospira]
MSETTLQASSYPFLGKVISVTGAGSGIGQATAQLLYARGATVALADINPSTLAETARALKEVPAQQGQLISTTVVDVTNEDDVFAWTKDIISTFGKLDGAANIPGGTGPLGPLATRTAANFDFTVNLNLRSVFNCMRAQLEQMQAGSSIVSVSTGLAIQANQNMSLYCSSKGAINSLTAAAARESGPKGIRVNAVAPGVIITPGSTGDGNLATIQPAIDVTPLGRAGQAVEVAKAIAFLLSSDACFVSGVILRCDGGYLSLNI